jgi:hypothetical protein
MTNTYRISPARLPELLVRLKKLALKAGVLGSTVPTWTVGPLNTEVVKVSELSLNEKVIAWHNLTLTSEPVKLAGWTFLATLDHASEAGVILRTVPGETVPVSYRTAAPVCDHCELARNRKETFVVRHEDGAFKVVGRNCLADFLGVDPERFAVLATMTIELGAALDDEEGMFAGGGGRAAHLFPLTTFLGFVAACIRTDGWLSRTAARDSGRQATVDGALFAMDPPAALSLREKNELPKPTDADFARGAAALSWARDLRHSGKELSDYEHNVAVVVAGEAISAKEAGIAGSIIVVYEKVLGRETERRLRALSDKDSVHFGTIGKRDVFTLTLVTSKTFDSDYGVRTMAKFLDASGNVAVWWTGELSDTDFPQGEAVTVKATVKDHTVYNTTNQTLLSRVALFTPPAPKAKKPRAKKAATTTTPTTVAHDSAAA